jgi:Ni,Fe-hydrogenase maturation factor
LRNELIHFLKILENIDALSPEQKEAFIEALSQDNEEKKEFLSRLSDHKVKMEKVLAELKEKVDKVD